MTKRCLIFDLKGIYQKYGNEKNDKKSLDDAYI